MRNGEGGIAVFRWPWWNVWRQVDPLGMVRGLWRQRSLIAQLTRREIRSRYRGSYLGVLWALLTPLATLLVYTFVFAVLFKARWGDRQSQGVVDFALTAFTGMTAFQVLSENLNRAPGLVVGRVNYVKRVVFPLEVLPISVLGASVFHSLIGLALVLIGQIVTVGQLHPTLIYLPLLYLPLVGFSLGLGWTLASLGVFVRDVGNFVGIATQLLFFVTPILYPVSVVPERLRPALTLNPISWVIEDFRRVILWGEQPAWDALAIVTALSIVVLLAGYVWFMKTKPGFADVI